MIKSVIIILILAISAVIAENFFAGGKIWHKGKFVLFRSVGHCFNSTSWKRVCIPAIAAGVVRYLTVIFSATWLAWLALIAFVAVGVYYACWYYHDGDRIRELIPFWFIFLVISKQLERVGGVIVPTLKSGTIAIILSKLLPGAMLFLAFGILLVVCLWRKGQKSEKEFYKWIAVILAILLLVGSIFAAVDAFKGFKSDKVDNASQASDATWYYFYNTDLQYDSDTENDYNFGSNPYNADWTARDYDQDFRARLEKDPALGAADIAWLDANVGTRFLGEFYDSCKGDWAKTINVAKVAWLKDHNLYKKTLVAFFAFLDTGKVEIAEGGKGITDQMYMNPYTVDTVPDVIVLKTDQQDGPFLVYSLTIKGNIKTVKYRIPCGYQPTNVEKVMNIAPQQKPSTSTPTKTTSQSKSSNLKDPSKSHNSGKNDDPGPGENTNTGVGSTKSSKEKPSNSNNLPNYSKYKEEIKELEETNKTAPSSNKPTTSTPAGTKVDNPGKEEVDAPAQKSEKVSGIKGDSNAQAWDGPAD